jgi:hypothetical protein
MMDVGDVYAMERYLKGKPLRTPEVRCQLRYIVFVSETHGPKTGERNFRDGMDEGSRTWL